MNRGFAYALVLGTLIVMMMLSIHLLHMLGTVGEVERSWGDLDQATLNIVSARNHFARTHADFQPVNGVQRFEFAPGNGFEYQMTPFGLFHLMKTRGYSGKQESVRLSLMGSLAPGQPPLQVGNLLTPGSDWALDGRITATPAAGVHDDLIALTDEGELDPFQAQGLPRHIRDQFTPAWEERLRQFFPQTASFDMGDTLDLSAVDSTAELVVIRGGSAHVSGTYQGSGFLVVISSGDLSFDQGLNQSNCLIMSRGQLQIRNGLSGSQCHLLAPHIQVNGAVKLNQATLTALVLPENSGEQATLALNGTGAFSGALTAVALAETSGRVTLSAGRANVHKSRELATSGVIFSSGSVTLRGNHRGLIRTQRWIHRDGNATYDGRLSDVDLAGGTTGIFPWGVPVYHAVHVFSWRERDAF